MEGSARRGHSPCFQASPLLSAPPSPPPLQVTQVKSLLWREGRWQTPLAPSVPPPMLQTATRRLVRHVAHVVVPTIYAENLCLLANSPSPLPELNVPSQILGLPLYQHYPLQLLLLPLLLLLLPPPPPPPRPLLPLLALHHLVIAVLL